MTATTGRPRKADLQSTFPVKCGMSGCGEVFANPTLAAKHVAMHRPIRRSPSRSGFSRRYEESEYHPPMVDSRGRCRICRSVDCRVAREAKVANLGPPAKHGKSSKTGVDRADSDSVISQHVGSDWRHVPCLCHCHFLEKDLVRRPCNLEKCKEIDA